MKTNTDKLLVEHDKSEKMFFLPIGDEKVYTLYRFIDDGTIEFYSTFTPPTLRGKGYARIVVEAALEYAAVNHHNIEASCWYVAKMIKPTQ